MSAPGQRAFEAHGGLTCKFEQLLPRERERWARVEQELSAVSPADAPTLPQNAPAAALLAEVEAKRDEAVQGRPGVADEVSNELALAAAQEGAQARVGSGDWRDDPCLQGPPTRVAAEARSCIGQPYVDARWDDTVRAFVAGATWQKERCGTSAPADVEPAEPVKRGRGRPVGSHGNGFRCGECGKPGHTVRTCGRLLRARKSR